MRTGSFFKIILSFNAMFLLIGCTINLDLVDKTESSVSFDLSNSSQFSFDPEFIELEDGGIALKPVDLFHSDNDFFNGTMSGTTVSESLILKQSGAITDLLAHQNTNLIGYWRFDETISPQIGPLTTEQIGTSGLNPKPGQLNSAIEFDGIDDRADFTSPTLNKITVLGWIRLDSYTNSFPRIISLNRELDVWVDEVFSGFENSLTIRIKYGSATAQWHTPKNSIRLKKWHHFAISYDSTSSSNDPVILIDGVVQNLYERSTPPSGTIDDTAGLSSIGGRPSGSPRPWDGFMDELALYSINLSIDDILSIYNAQREARSDDGSHHPSWTPHWQNVLGYWKMGENGLDSSDNNFHGQKEGDFQNSTDSSQKKVGESSGVFNGIDAALRISHSPTLKPDEFTVSAWFNLSGSPVAQTILSNYEGGGFYLRFNTNDIEFRVEDETTTNHSLTFDHTQLTSGWHHVMAAYGDGQARLYINGSLVSQAKDITGSVGYGFGTQPFCIGADAHLTACTQGPSFYFEGFIDDVVFWDTPLSPSDVIAVYNRQKQLHYGQFESEVIGLGHENASWADLFWTTELPFGKPLNGTNGETKFPDSESALSSYPAVQGDVRLGLLGYWSFDENSENTGPDFSDFTDHSGNDLHFHESEGVGFLAPGALGTGVYFDGVDDFIESPLSISDSIGWNDDFTISLWVNLPQEQVNLGTTLNRILLRTTTSISDNISFRNATNPSSNKIQYFRNDGTNRVTLLSTSEINDGRFHHLLVKKQSDQLFLFIDGVLEDQKTDVTTLNEDFESLRLGRNIGPTSALNGTIDEFGIWSRALTDTEVLQLYRRGANRVKLQIKSCIDENCECESYSANPQGSTLDCDGDGVPNGIDKMDEHQARFVGPGGDGTTFYSELYNRRSEDILFDCAQNFSDTSTLVCSYDEITIDGVTSGSSPGFTLQSHPQFQFPKVNPYFQYRVYLESDENVACGGNPCLPQLSSVGLTVPGTNRYHGETQTIENKIAIAYRSLESIQIQGDDCVSFQLSPNQETYYFWHENKWVESSDPSQRSSAEEVQNNIKAFSSQFGAGRFSFKTFLSSDTHSQCRLSNINLSYKKPL